MAVDRAVDREHGRGIPRGPQQHDADLELVETEMEESVVELPPGGDRPGARAGLEEGRRRLRLPVVGRPHGEGGNAFLAVDREPHPAVVDAGRGQAR